MADSALNIVQKYYPNVTKVMDAKQPVLINVTPKDCRGAKSKDFSSCAFAKACKRDYDGAIVSLSVAYLIKGELATRYKVPAGIAREIVSFDRNHDFRQGEYWLNAPSKAMRLGPRRHPQPKNKANYARVKRRYHRTGGIRSLKLVA
jgi:hypothetical protein